MTRPVCLQVYVSRELAGHVREAARLRDLSTSDWVRSLLLAACIEDHSVSRIDGSIERILRQCTFAMVGIDALLAGHTDHELRDRAHQAYTRKCRELGLGLPGEKRRSDEC